MLIVTRIVGVNRNLGIALVEHPEPGEKPIEVLRETVLEAGIRLRDLAPGMNTEIDVTLTSWQCQVTAITHIEELSRREVREQPVLRAGCKCTGEVIERRGNCGFLRPDGFPSEKVFCCKDDVKWTLWGAFVEGNFFSFVTRHDPSGPSLRAVQLGPCRRAQVL